MSDQAVSILFGASFIETAQIEIIFSRKWCILKCLILGARWQTAKLILIASKNGMRCGAMGTLVVKQWAGYCRGGRGGRLGLLWTSGRGVSEFSSRDGGRRGEFWSWGVDGNDYTLCYHRIEPYPATPTAVAGLLLCSICVLWPTRTQTEIWNRFYPAKIAKHCLCVLFLQKI